MADDLDSLVPLVRRTAALARLEVAPAEADELARDFARILEAFRSLAEGAAPAAPSGAAAPRPSPPPRPDVPHPFPDPGILMRAAPEPELGPEGAFFAVPKTFGDAP